MKNITWLVLGCLLTAPLSVLADNDKSKDKIKFKVLQKSFYEGCPYALNVGLAVKYKFKSADNGILVLEGTRDGVNYEELLTEEIEKGRGHTVLNFDAGACIKDLRLSIQ